MKKFPSILVVVPPQSPKATVKQLVLSSMALGQWMGSEVHLLPAIGETQGVVSTLHELTQRQERCPYTVTLPPIAPGDRISEIVEKNGCSLIVTVDGVLLDSKKGTDERKLLELSLRPVLVFPSGFDLKATSVRGFLVPLSGETRTNEALSVALRLAEQTHSAVDLLHVATPDEANHAHHQDLDTLSDQIHHEYRQMAEKIVAEASPFSTADERSRVRQVFHYEGSIASEIIKLIHQFPESILSLQWNGTFAPGRAETIKDILQTAACPILFVKTSREEKSILRVGRYLRAA
jgi:nucleotide-binding universal stress UspA family protein